jgi:phage-related tail protein
MNENVVKRVSTIFTINDDGYNKSLADINKQMKLTQSEIKLAGERLKAFGETTGDLKSKQEALTKQITNVRDKMSLYNKSIEDTNQRLSKNRSELLDLAKSKDELNKKYQEAIKLYGIESKEAEGLRQELNKTKEAYKEKEQVIKNNVDTLNRHNLGLKNSEAELAGLQGELRKTNTELATNESRWIKNGKAMETAGKKMKDFGSKMSSAGNVLTLGVTTPIIAIGTAATKMAMDAVESENLFEVSMGKMANSARAWSESLRKELGLNAYELRENAATFNAMLTSMGLSEKQAYDFSTSLTKLSYDMASFYNLDPSVAFDKLRSGISGESEPLKQLGILVNENTVELYAYQNGIAKTGAELTEQQKVQARYGVIMKQTAKAQGDLGRTLDSPTNKLRIQKEQLKQTGIELGQKLIPLMNKGLDVIKPIIEYISNLSDAQKESIIRMGLMTAAAGPLLSVGGKAISVSGSVVGSVGKIAEALGKAKAASAVAGTAASVAGGAGGFGALASGLGAAATAALPWVAGAAVVAGAGYAIYKGLSQETIPAIDLFADKVESTSVVVNNAGVYMAEQYDVSITRISDSTKKAIGAYVALDDGAKENLNSLYLNSTVITDQIKRETVSKFTDMKNQIVAGYEAQKNESLAKLQEMFRETQSITSMEQQIIMKQTADFYESKKVSTASYEKQIQDIMSKASAEKRSLTTDEMNVITNLQNQMKENAVKALSENEIEAQVILQRMKDYDERITAEQASNHIKKLNESRDKAVQAANEEYEKRIALVIKMRDEAHSISADQADKMLEEAKRQRDGVIQSAEETRKGAVDKIFGMNTDLVNNVDSTTGKITNIFQRLFGLWDKWKPNKKMFEYQLSGSGGKINPIAANASGTDYFQGGLTYMNEKGYELYDLPKGTRIYNHEASQDLVIKTAEAVAAKMAGSGSTVNHTGIIRLEGVNDRNQLMGVVDLVMDQLRKEVRA